MEEKEIRNTNISSSLDLHLLECPICLSTLIKPISLLCGHK